MDFCQCMALGCFQPPLIWQTVMSVNETVTSVNAHNASVKAYCLTCWGNIELFDGGDMIKGLWCGVGGGSWWRGLSGSQPPYCIGAWNQEGSNVVGVWESICQARHPPYHHHHIGALLFQGSDVVRRLRVWQIAMVQCQGWKHLRHPAPLLHGRQFKTPVQAGTGSHGVPVSFQPLYYMGASSKSHFQWDPRI